MLQIVVPGTELWDSEKQEFVYTKEFTLQLEHSLVSVSKWESKWEKPFLSKTERSTEETIDYVRCMTLNHNVDPSVYERLTPQNYEDISKYINAKRSATWFAEDKTNAKPSREVVTSELIYYWMVASTIPLECEKWHLNRLLTLIRICGIKNKPPKKMSKKDLAKRNTSLNALRRQQMGTNG